MTRKNMTDRDHAVALLYAAEHLLSDVHSDEGRERMVKAIARARKDLYPTD